jgi:hypothetical protein
VAGNQQTIKAFSPDPTSHCCQIPTRFYTPQSGKFDDRMLDP